MSRELIIDGRRIDDASDCYVIAEVGHNHQGRLDTALRLLEKAKAAGADAVKLQKRHNRSLYTRAAYAKPYDNENSFGATYGEHREALEFGRREYQELLAHARRLGLTLFATAFDPPSADFLAALDVPAYKIASGDLRNTPLLRHVARIGKPMILSTGGALIDDVQRAVDAVLPINPQAAILQCTASYPVAFEEMDLAVVATYRERFPNCVIGLSAHDNGIAMSLAAYMLGARIIEKHFTLNRAMKGTDHAFSLEPIGLEKLVRDLRRARVAIGDGRKKIHESERSAMLKMGKSIVAAADLPAGTVLTPKDLTIKCPGGGLHPYQWDLLIGKRTVRPLAADEMVRFEDLAL
jgi:N-acetylneuraminate synthase/sialic acid synthase